jgi:hypothetical protein
MSYFDLSGFNNPQIKRSIPPSLMMDYVQAPENEPPAQLPFTPTLQDPSQALSSFDPQQALQANEAATRYALAQRLGILAPNSNVPPLPDDQQRLLDQRAGMIQSALGPGPLEKKYIDQLNTAFSNQPVHGFKARLAGFGKGLLMGEGLPGAIRGAADPTTMNLRYRLSQLAPLFGGVQQEQAFAGSTLGRAKQLGELTGYDPMTGLPTPKYDYQMNYLGPAAMQRAQTGQQRANDYGRNVTSQIDTRNDRVDIARLNAQLRGREKGGVLTQQEITDIETQFGIRLPASYDPQKQEIKLDEHGKYIIINKTTAAVTPTGVTSYEPEKQKQSTKRAEIGATGRTTPEERKEDRDIRKGHLSVSQQAERDRQEAAAHKQAESENPLPHFPNDAQIAERNQKVADRVNQIMQGKTPPTATATPTASLPSGEKIIRRQRSKSTGRVLLTIQKSDGSTYTQWQ